MMFIYKCLTYVFSGSAIEWLPDEGAKGLVAKRCLIPLLNPGVDGRQNNVDKPSKYSKEPPSVNPPNSLHI